MVISAEQFDILQKEYDQGSRRLCLMDVHLRIGNNTPYTFSGVVYGYQPFPEIQKDQDLIDSLITRMCDTTKSIGVSNLKHKGKIVVKIQSVTFTHITNGYKKL